MPLAPSLRSLLDRPEAIRRLGPFVLVHQLGRGGFAPVWLAREVYDGVEIRRAAVKLFAFDPGASEDARSKIMEEARLLCRVEHPNIPRFYSLLSDDSSGVMGLVMEYVDGASLEKRIHIRRRLPAHETLAIGIAIASSLSAIHRAGLVHRDVKPANIIDTGGGYKLIDFGIAASGPARGDSTAPDVGDLLPVGTPGYIDPQCVATTSSATPASDLYSLGATLFECLTGKLPSVITAGAGGGMQAEILDGRMESPKVAEHTPEIPAELAALIDALLSPRREKRPASAESVALRLERIRAEKLGRKIVLPPEEIGPFRGLARFEGSDRDVYFGRSAEVAATVDLLRRRGLVTLIGASGAGKSSLARAGVAPLVAEEGLGGWIKRWDVFITTPGPHPREAVAQALAEVIPRAGELDPGALAERMAQGAESRGKGLLLVVDPLEELVTVSDPGEAAWLAELLARAADPPHPFVRILAATRRDLLDPLLSLGPLGVALPRSLLVVAPMSGADWASAIDQALSAYGYSFEDPALRDELLAEIESRATAMPLVQFALTELWKHRDPAKKLIPRKGLAEIGGLSGALERHAEATLAHLLAETSIPLTSVREVLLAMTTPQGTRAMRSLAELEALIGPDVHPLIGHLESARLVVREDGGLTLMHDTLLGQWWRLRDWIATAREDRLLAEDIERDAARWAKENEDPSLLWKKRRLVAAEDLLRVGLVQLSPLAERFVKATRPRERRARLGLAAASLLALGAAAALGFRSGDHAVSAGMEAERPLADLVEWKEVARRREQALCDEAAELRERAAAALSRGAALRTLEILEKAKAACPASAKEGLAIELRALASLGRWDEHDRRRGEHPDHDDSAVPRDLETGALRSAPVDPDPLSLLRRGQEALAAGEAARGRLAFDRAIHVLSTREQKPLAIDLPWQLTGDVAALAWSAKEAQRLTVIHGRWVTTTDTSTGRQISRVPIDSEVAALSSDGTRVAFAAREGGVKILDTGTGLPIRTLPEGKGTLFFLAMAGSPARLITVRKGGLAQVWGWEVSSPLGRLPLDDTDKVHSVAISASGEAVALGLSSGTVRIFRAGDASGVTLAPGDAGTWDGVSALALSPDGNSVAWTDDHGATFFSRAAANARISPLDPGARAVTFCPDGKSLFTLSPAAANQWTLTKEGVSRGSTTPLAAGAKVIACSSENSLAVGSDRRALTVHSMSRQVSLGSDVAGALALTFTPRGDALVAAMEDGSWRSFSLTRGGHQEVRRSPLAARIDRDRGVAITVSPDGKQILSTGADSTRLWPAMRGDPAVLGAAEDRGAVAASFSADGARALTVSSAGKVRVFDVAARRAAELRQSADVLLAAAFEPNGKEVLSIVDDGARIVWDAATGEQLRFSPGQRERYKFAALSPDHKTFVIWRHRALELRDTASGELVRKLAEPGDEMVRMVSFSPEGDRLFGAGDGQSIPIWSTASGEITGTWTGVSRPARALSVSPLGKLVALAIDGGVVLLFRQGSSGPVATIAALAGDGKDDAALVLAGTGHVDVLGPGACQAREKLTCRVGQVPLPFEVCEDRYFFPGLLSSLASGDSSYAAPDTPHSPLVCPP